ncbi:hypothetical protein HII13_002563 [Brettanomyces bruxellensis]|nr:hypothetical protein HII13_002563 [Brettanomyces bruxellensis]
MPDDSGSRGQMLLFMILMLYFMSSTPPEDAGYPPMQDRRRIMHEFRQELAESRKALSGDYSSGYGNLTGFRLSYGDVLEGRNASDWPFPDKGQGSFEETQKYSILPDAISEKAASVWNTEERVVELPRGASEGARGTHEGGAYHLNVTGYVQGGFTRVEVPELHEIPMHVPQYYDKLREYRQIESEINDFESTNGDSSSLFAEDGPVVVGGQGNEQKPASGVWSRPGNVTYDQGGVKIRIGNTRSGNGTQAESPAGHRGVSVVDLHVQLSDPGEKVQDEVALSGVYHAETGNIVAVTRSAKFAGPYALPHLNLGPGKAFDGTRDVYSWRMAQTPLQDLQFGVVSDLLEQSASCEYIAYLHVQSTDLSEDQLREIDAELENPLGRPHARIPHLQVSGGILYSPDCRVVLSVGQCEGQRHEVQTMGLQRVVLGCAVLVIAQIWMFVNQMHDTSTPSTLSRLAFWTVALINVADGSLSMVMLLCSMIYKELYLQFIVAAFLAFVCSSIYEMKYAIQIYAAQTNERPLTWRTAFQGSPIDEREEQQQQQQQQQQLPTPIPEDEQSVAARLYMRYFFGMLLLLFLGLNVTTWPKTQRKFMEYAALIVTNSYWIPQIYRNVIRGSRRSFSWSFMLGISALRLVPLVYLFTFSNPLRHHRDPAFVAMLAIWVSAQLLLMFLQEVVGPRFFLPEKYLPKTYNYHQILTKADLENGYNFESFVGGDNGTQLKCKLDCAICMQSLEIPVIDTQLGSTSQTSGMGTSAANLLASRNYMVTPCRHIFHTACLEGWMRYKLQCPVCRNSLPPL